MNRCTKQDFEKISAIANRAHGGSPILNERGKIDLMMDLEFAHIDCPIKLDDLLAADDGNFMHDITGIVCNMNRNTKKLDNCFVPRYAA